MHRIDDGHPGKCGIADGEVEELGDMLQRIWNGLIPRDCWDPEQRRVAAAVRAVGMSFVVGILPALYLQWSNNGSRALPSCWLRKSRR